MATYTLSANPAEVRDGGWTESFSWLNDQLDARTAVIEAKNADELTAAKEAHGRAVLAANTLRPQHANVTSERRPLNAVAVSARPVTRHANGCKAVPFVTLVTR